MSKKIIIFIIFSYIFFSIGFSQKKEKPIQNIYYDGWIDLNKNGKMDVYENPILHM